MAANPAGGAEVLGSASLCLAAPSGEDSDGVVILCTPRLVSSQGSALRGIPQGCCGRGFELRVVVPLARTHICGSARVVGSITHPVGTVTSGSVRLVSLVILYPYE